MPRLSMVLVVLGLAACLGSDDASEDTPDSCEVCRIDDYAARLSSEGEIDCGSVTWNDDLGERPADQAPEVVECVERAFADAMPFTVSASEVGSDSILSTHWTMTDDGVLYRLAGDTGLCDWRCVGNCSPFIRRRTCVDPTFEAREASRLFACGSGSESVVVCGVANED